MAKYFKNYKSYTSLLISGKLLNFGHSTMLQWKLHVLEHMGTDSNLDFDINNKILQRSSVMAQHPNPCLPCAGSHMGTSSCPTALIAIQLPTCGLGKQQRITKTLWPCTHMTEWEENSGSWFWIVSALAVAAIWGMKQWMEELCISLFLHVFLSNKRKSVNISKEI